MTPLFNIIQQLENNVNYILLTYIPLQNDQSTTYHPRERKSTEWEDPHTQN